MSSVNFDVSPAALRVPHSSFPIPPSLVPHSSYLCVMKVDYLIVGQGIAGSVMALTLEQRGKSVGIINEAGLSSSSRIAAGVFNPVNFRRTTPTWKVEDSIGALLSFYDSAEKLLGEQFHTSETIFRLFTSEEEAAKWKTQLAKPGSKFILPVDEGEKLGAIKRPFGFGGVSGGGIVRTEKFIEEVRKHFSNRGYYLNELFDHTKLFPNENSIVYDERVEASHLIFCEGHLAEANPFFDPKLIAPTKGELIHVHIPHFGIRLAHGQVYVAALDDQDNYVCGATFNPGKHDEEITASGKDELIAKLKAITDLPFEVIGHYAGVRPAGRDRKAVIGRSRNHRNLSIFNGFGSKAVLMSPFLAQMLANHLENGAEILPEVNVSRFKVY